MASKKDKESPTPAALSKTIPCAKLTSAGVCPEGRKCNYSHKVSAKYYSGTGFMDYVVPMITEITKAQIVINQQLTQALERLSSLESRVDRMMEVVASTHKRVGAICARRGQNRSSSRHTRDNPNDQRAS